MSVCTIVAVMVAASVLLGTASAKNPPPHLVMILQDDLGHYDIGWNNPANLDVSANISALAKSGVILTNHYVFYWCSPTRRSFLTGRLPLHHGEMLSGYNTDDIDLRWNVLSQKLQPMGYRSYWFGKGHTGYKSVHHLPTNRGFEAFTGFLSGAQSYFASDRWKNGTPYDNTEYSTYLYGNDTLHAVANHPPSVPMFLYLPWQAVHLPHMPPPDWEGDKYRGMLWAADVYVGALVQLLKAKGMWENTLLVYSSDNGGTVGGNNYPLRGYKRTNWEGGMRVAAFAAGGLLPDSVRGTSNNIRMHIVDWYTTFCHLAGVEDASDASPVAPLPVDPSDPTKDIYGNTSWPAVDGVDVWEALTDPGKYSNDNALHPSLVLSSQVVLNGTYKLLVAERGDTHQSHYPFENGWEQPNGTWVQPVNQTCGLVDNVFEHTVFKPCLFDLATDPREEHDLSQEQPELLNALWKQLNTTWLTYYHSRTPPDMLGPCNPKCANTWLKDHGGVPDHGPQCGVPGCS